jgi:pyrroloquinoline quinone (PQQ) biosynthesis protein C
MQSLTSRPPAASPIRRLATTPQLRVIASPPPEERPAAFVAELAREALAHRAVTHPYLADLACDRLPDPRWALADFARHYLGYSRAFPRYLCALISRLDDPRQRQGLFANLTEEAGVYADAELAELAALGVRPEWIEGVPHPALFCRFARALGVDPDEREIPEADEVACWRELFLAVLSHGSPAEAVGALGLGTENIVSTIYRPFVLALSRLDLDPRDTVFFPLHTAVDDHHQATLQAIAAAFAHTPEGRVGLRRGMLKALSLRTAFWDWLHARALNRHSFTPGALP